MIHSCGTLREVGFEFAGGFLPTSRKVIHCDVVCWAPMREVAGCFPYTLRVCAHAHTHARMHVGGVANNLPQRPATGVSDRVSDCPGRGCRSGRFRRTSARPPAELLQTSRMLGRCGA